MVKQLSTVTTLLCFGFFHSLRSGRLEVVVSGGLKKERGARGGTSRAPVLSFTQILPSDALSSNSPSINTLRSEVFLLHGFYHFKRSRSFGLSVA